jgi:hypothetical protein
MLFISVATRRRTTAGIKSFDYRLWFLWNEAQICHIRLGIRRRQLHPAGVSPVARAEATERFSAFGGTAKASAENRAGTWGAPVMY